MKKYYYLTPHSQENGPQIKYLGSFASLDEAEALFLDMDKTPDALVMLDDSDLYRFIEQAKECLNRDI